jgi:hypothetical protein
VETTEENKMNRALFGAALTVLSVTLPAMAATTDSYQFRGQNAYADFYQSDECSSSSVSVFAAENVSKSAPGAPTAQKDAHIYYSTSNWCKGTYSYGHGTAANVDFQATNQLNSASLKGTFTVSEYSPEATDGTTKTVDVALTWTGDGETFRGSSHSHYQWMGGISNYRSVGSSRNAKVSGNVTMDGKNLISNMSGFAQLSSSNSGSMQVTRR